MDAKANYLVTYLGRVTSSPRIRKMCREYLATPEGTAGKVKPNLDNDGEARRVGEVLARVLQLPRKRWGFETSQGKKNHIGLARTVAGIINGEVS